MRTTLGKNNNTRNYIRDVRDTVTSHVPFAPLTHKQHSLISAYPWPTNWDKFNVQWVASTLSNWVDKIGNERLTKTTQKGSGGTYRSMGPPPGSRMSGWFICSVGLWFFLSIRKIYEAFSIGEASNNQKFTLSMIFNQRALSTRLSTIYYKYTTYDAAVAALHYY